MFIIVLSNFTKPTRTIPDGELGIDFSTSDGSWMFCRISEGYGPFPILQGEVPQFPEASLRLVMPSSLLGALLLSSYSWAWPSIKMLSTCWKRVMCQRPSSDFFLKRRIGFCRFGLMLQRWNQAWKGFDILATPIIRDTMKQGFCTKHNGLWRDQC